MPGHCKREQEARETLSSMRIGAVSWDAFGAWRMFRELTYTAPDKDMCFTCECLKADIREIEERLKKTACQRRKQLILTGRHRKKLKQPERQAYYSQYYQANREKKLAYCRERYQERKAKGER